MTFDESIFNDNHVCSTFSLEFFNILSAYFQEINTPTIEPKEEIVIKFEPQPVPFDERMYDIDSFTQVSLQGIL